MLAEIDEQEANDYSTSVDLSPKVFYFNVGGNHFIIESSKLKKFPDTRLGGMPVLPHHEVMKICDGYFAKSKEFFFDRSAIVFDQGMLEFEA